jgi:hypothetical protein
MCIHIEWSEMGEYNLPVIPYNTCRDLKLSDMIDYLNYLDNLQKERFLNCLYNYASTIGLNLASIIYQ